MSKKYDWKGDEIPVTHRVYDWKPKFDDQSQMYPVRTAIVHTEPRSYTWRCLKQLDQGYEGACVGYGIAHELIARPKELLHTSEMDARRIYFAAQREDEWEGEDYEGTSVLAGMKVAKTLGYYSGYRWAFGIEDVKLAVSWLGPVVIGVNWYEGMENTDKDGFIHPTGNLRGGHCTIINAYNKRLDRYKGHNSWGPYWGMNGEFYISGKDLAALLKDSGEACIPVSRLSGGR